MKACEVMTKKYYNWVNVIVADHIHAPESLDMIDMIVRICFSRPLHFEFSIPAKKVKSDHATTVPSKELAFFCFDPDSCFL